MSGYVSMVRFSQGQTSASCAPQQPTPFNPTAHVCNAPCPANAVCYGGSTIVPLNGFWHSAFDSEAMVACPNPSACQGARGPLLACQDPNNTSMGVSVQDQVGLRCASQLHFGVYRHTMSVEGNLRI